MFMILQRSSLRIRSSRMDRPVWLLARSAYLKINVLNQKMYRVTLIVRMERWELCIIVLIHVHNCKIRTLNLLIWCMHVYKFND